MPQLFVKILWQQFKQQPYLFCQTLVTNQTTCFATDFGKPHMWLVPNLRHGRLWPQTKQAPSQVAISHSVQFCVATN